MLEDQDLILLPSGTNTATKNRRKRDKYPNFMVDVGQEHPGFAIKLIVLIAGCLGRIKTDFLRELNIIPTSERNPKVLVAGFNECNYSEKSADLECT